MAHRAYHEPEPPSDGFFDEVIRRHYVRAFAPDPMEEGDVGGRHLEDERLLLLNSGARARPPGRGHGAV